MIFIIFFRLFSFSTAGVAPLNWTFLLCPVALTSCRVTLLTIYNQEGTDTLVMNIQTAGDIDFSAATGPGSRYRKDPKCQEWEELMSTEFHHGWTELKEIHASDNQWNKQLGKQMTTCTANAMPMRCQCDANAMPMPNLMPICNVSAPVPVVCHSNERRRRIIDPQNRTTQNFNHILTTEHW